MSRQLSSLTAVFVAGRGIEVLRFLIESAVLGSISRTLFTQSASAFPASQSNDGVFSFKPASNAAPGKYCVIHSVSK